MMAEQPKLLDKLLMLPFFQGMSRNELYDIVEHTPFDFFTIQPGKHIVTDGTACTTLIFMLQGQLQSVSYANDKSYHICESMKAPCVIQPENLFGYHPHYTSSFVAESPCNFMAIHKKDVLQLTNSSMIFRLNFLNTFATASQKLRHTQWQPVTKGTESRILKFIADHCSYPAGKKVISIKMTDLAEQISESRLNVSHVLNHWQQKGLVELHRGTITIPKFEDLLRQTQP